MLGQAAEVCDRHHDLLAHLGPRTDPASTAPSDDRAAIEARLRATEDEADLLRGLLHAIRDRLGVDDGPGWPARMFEWIGPARQV